VSIADSLIPLIPLSHSLTLLSFTGRADLVFGKSDL
jgi:hypothetical protein